MSSWGFTNDFNSFLGFLGLRLGFSFLRFLGLRLGLGLNKMDLAYVCMSWVLYKILYYTWVLRICTYLVLIFCMILSTWLHTTLLYEGLDNVFALPNLQTPSFKFSQVVFVPFQKFVLMSSQNKLLSQQLCKATHTAHMWLGSIWNFCETWTIMSTTISQNFSSFNFIKWEILLLPRNHLKLGPEHKMTYNSLSTTPNSLKFWERH